MNMKPPVTLRSVLRKISRLLLVIAIELAFMLLLLI